MMLDIVLDADPEWDSSTGWDELAAKAVTAAIAESAFPQLAKGPRGRPQPEASTGNGCGGGECDSSCQARGA